IVIHTVISVIIFILQNVKCISQNIINTYAIKVTNPQFDCTWPHMGIAFIFATQTSADMGM
ncbi:hypothetical protein M5D96_001015, partial [Drosophila gunungcola]